MSSDIHLFTSESVGPGHPDKVSDQISDAILDAYLAQDPNSRVACETLCTTGLVLVAGEITSEGKIDIPQVVRDTITRIGYTDPTLGFDANTCAVLTTIDRQSPDISQGVTEGDGLHSAQGAGDQGIMFGYACDETDVLMPLPIVLAHRLMEELTRLRTSGDLPYLRPDGKGQVTVEYHDGKPHRVHTVVVSTQHSEDVDHATLEADLIEKLAKKVIPSELLDGDTIYHMNPTGRFVHGGPYGDAGVTGRKIIVDTYGGKGSHGGGAFSGKDPSKVDRSATYAARYVAKNIVAAGLATQCEVQLAYAIGVSEPISILIETNGTGTIPDKDLVQLVRDNFDLTPKGIIDKLELKRPIYSQTACYGHFGRELDDFKWEMTDKADALKAAAGKVESHQTEKAPVA